MKQRKGHRQAKDIQEWINRQAGRKGELQAALRRLLVEFRKRETTNPLWWHAVGTDVLRFFPDGTRHYSDKVIALLADKLVPNPDTKIERVFNIIWQARQIARSLTKEQIKDWAKKRDSKGRPLSASRVHRLVSVPDKAQRDELLERCLSESWGVERLSSEIQNLFGRKRSRGRRKPNERLVPKPGVALQEIQFSARHWLDNHEVWFDGKNAPLRKVHEQEQTVALYQELKRATDEIDKLKTKLDDELKCLERLASKMEKKLDRE